MVFVSVTFALSLIALSGFYFWNQQAIREFAPSLAAFYAKSFCSCFFISERSVEECHEYSKQYIPIESFQLDAKLKLVQVRAIGEQARVFYINQREGCSLEPL